MSAQQVAQRASRFRGVVTGLTVSWAAVWACSPAMAGQADTVTVANTTGNPIPVAGTIAVKPPPTFHALSLDLPFAPVAVDLTQRGTVTPSYEKCRVSLGLIASFLPTDQSTVIVYDLANQTHRLAVLDVRGNAPVNFVVDAPGNGFVLYVSAGAANNPPGAEVYCR